MDDLQTRLEQWVNAADIYQREVSKLRAERDAMAVLLTEAAECLDKSWGDDSEDPVAAKIRAHLNAQPDVGSASSQPDDAEGPA